MESRRAAGLLIAVLSAILIVLAGRSCAKDIEKQNKRNAKAATKSAATAEAATPAPAKPPEIQDPQQPQQPEQPTETDPAQTEAPPAEGETLEATEAPTKSKLDEFWDSEHPSYLDPYGFLDENDPYGDGGNGNYQATIHIEIG